MPVNLNENSMQQFQNLPAHIQQRIADQSAMDRTGQYGGVFPASQAELDRQTAREFNPIESQLDKLRSMTLDDAMYGVLDTLEGAEDVLSPIQTLFPDISRPGGESYGMSPEDLQQGLNSHAASYYDMVGRVPDETVAKFDAVTNPLTFDRANYPPQAGPDPDSTSGFMRFLGEGLTTPVNLAEGGGLAFGVGLGVKGLMTAIKKKMKNKRKSKPDATQPPRKSKPKATQSKAELMEELTALERRQIASKAQERTGRMPFSHRRARDRQQKQIDDLRRLTDGQD
jgi:hypothetical protein